MRTTGPCPAAGFRTGSFASSSEGGKGFPPRVRKLISLDAHLMVFPGHSPSPIAFDGDVLTESLGEVAGRLGDWLGSEDQFVQRIVARLPPTPPNYVTISDLNRRGEWPESDVTDLEAGANRCAVS